MAHLYIKYVNLKIRLRYKLMGEQVQQTGSAYPRPKFDLPKTDQTTINTLPEIASQMRETGSQNVCEAVSRNLAHFCNTVKTYIQQGFIGVLENLMALERAYLG